MAAPKAKKPSQKSHLELAFLRTWEIVAGMEFRPVQQHRFAAPERQWRFDFAWPDQRVAVEIDGGIFIGGGHSRGVQFTQDCEKLNSAVMKGWRVLRFTTLSLKQEPVQCVELTLKLVRYMDGLRQNAGAQKQGGLF